MFNSVYFYKINSDALGAAFNNIHEEKARIK